MKGLYPTFCRSFGNTRTSSCIPLTSLQNNMPKVFEFHFNPTSPAGFNNQNTVFETFCFTPKTKMEKQRGTLYLLGEIENPLPQSRRLLNSIAEVIKQGFYTLDIEPEGAFQQGLNNANNFLAEQIQAGNTNFLGNLNFAVVALSPYGEVSLSKTGNAKVILLRQGEAFDMCGELNKANTSGQTFPKVIEGQLSKHDKLFMATENIFDNLYQQKILETISFAEKQQEIKQTFREYKKILRTLDGCCLLALVKRKKRKGYNVQAQSLHNSPFLSPKLQKILLVAFILMLLLFIGSLVF